MSSAGSYGSGGGGGVGNVKFLTGNTGGPVGPDITGNINIVGAGDITVAGNAGTETLTIQLSGAIANTYDADTGTAIPALGILNIVGGSGISTTGSGNTITIEASGGGGVSAITGDIGASATGSVEITGGVSGAIFTESGGNTLTESFDFLAMSDTNGSGTTGYMAIGGSTVFAMFGGVANTNVIIGPGSGAAGMSGVDNTACGASALNGITTGSSNTSIGSGSLASITTAANNVAIGVGALGNLDTGQGGNCAIGASALNTINTGRRNIGIGAIAGNALTGSDSDNILIANTGVSGDVNTIRIGTDGSGAGQQNLCFIAGIAGVTVSNSAAVLIDTTSGQLGTVPSSERYKEDIHDMQGDSHNILNLRPVSFSYKNDPQKQRQYGLIAEEVEKVMPYLVSYNKDGLPETVRYHEICTFLINEVKMLSNRIRSLEEQFATRIR